MNSVTTESQSEVSRGMAPRGQIVLVALTLFALWFVLCRHLSSEWSVNEQYSYGWFVPFFALFLFWLRWEDRPAPGRTPDELPTPNAQRPTSNWKGLAIGIAIVALFTLFPLRLVEVANPDWRPLGWLHAAAVVALTLLVIWAAGGKPWVRHFAFPVCFFFVAVPWVSAIEQPIVQGLMRIVAAVATDTIALFGIPAQLEGNLIRVSTGVVGVNEACSGVRSLQTSLMIGLLFGELKRVSLPKRFVLVLGAVALAILANFGRALFLVWVAATRGVPAVAEWHDFAGYAIVGVVFLGTLLLTALLARRASKVGSRKYEVGNENAPTSDLRRPTSPFILPASYFLLSLVWLLAIEFAVEGWYRSHEKDLAAGGTWTVQPPEKAPGFREIPIDEGVRQTLRFDEGREVTWKSTSPGAAATIYLFFFRWNPGSASVLRARAHRPDICLPSIGWTLAADLGARNYSGAGDTSITARHVTFRQAHGNVIAHTFFCLQEDKIHRREARADLLLPQGVQPDWSFAARLRMVREGIRNLGQQVLETIVISPTPIEDAAAEERFQEMVKEMVGTK